MSISANTDGERIVQLEGKIDVIDGKVTYVVESLERVLIAFEKLEEVRLADHEARIITIERWQSEFRGMWRLVSGIALLLGIASIILGIITYNK